MGAAVKRLRPLDAVEHGFEIRTRIVNGKLVAEKRLIEYRQKYGCEWTKHCGRWKSIRDRP